MDNSEIDKAIKHAMSFKRQGLISQALAIEEYCFLRCKADKATSIEGMAMIVKALGKIYYADNKIEKAKDFFAAAIELYFNLAKQVDPAYQAEVENCAFYLGACSPDFLKSSLKDEVRNGLTFGGIPAGQPGSGMSMEKVNEIEVKGMQMFMFILSSNVLVSPVQRILG